MVRPTRNTAEQEDLFMSSLHLSPIRSFLPCLRERERLEFQLSKIQTAACRKARADALSRTSGLVMESASPFSALIHFPTWTVRISPSSPTQWLPGLPWKAYEPPVWRLSITGNFSASVLYLRSYCHWVQSIRRRY